MSISGSGGGGGGTVTLTNCESVSTVTVLKREERRRVAVTVPPDVSHPYSVKVVLYDVRFEGTAAVSEVSEHELLKPMSLLLASTRME